ncbi:MAG: phosphate signaling complex protein PhoU [Candidatus Mcinerneyibacterium aminivorans]|uniref:Phosphate-specific transport system accessory protein PhoU n=1 Tax=Candidatus Mcinerneyibacterium aminivorans TaxID=2703815 RepID=A0A5D0MJW0_9BACT|nr:MAG: phosphate signaling complex protein PhoU [Candidatus Mcinerneyibacterium aminivorans]
MIVEKKLNEIKEKLLYEANITKKMIKFALEGVLYNNREKLHNQILCNEEKVNETEIKIDEKSVSFIARYQPEARHLRTIFTVIKINNDLERIADLAVNISDNFLKLNRNEDDDVMSMVKNVGEKTRKMLEMSIDSFMNQDIELAEKVIESDDEVDEGEKEIMKKLVEKLKKRKDATQFEFYYYRIAKSFERIADLSTNIAEDTIYMSRGNIVKHANRKDNKNDE